jgi:hypothetical protein
MPLFIGACEMTAASFAFVSLPFIVIPPRLDFVGRCTLGAVIRHFSALLYLKK